MCEGGDGVTVGFVTSAELLPPCNPTLSVCLSVCLSVYLSACLSALELPYKVLERNPDTLLVDDRLQVSWEVGGVCVEGLGWGVGAVGGGERGGGSGEGAWLACVVGCVVSAWCVACG